MLPMFTSDPVMEAKRKKLPEPEVRGLRKKIDECILLRSEV